MTREEAIQELRSAMDRILGLMYYGSGDEAISDAMYDVLTHNHRTCQQRFVSNIVQVLLRYADEHHDIRNEAAVRLCGIIRAAVERSRYWGQRGLPYY